MYQIKQIPEDFIVKEDMDLKLLKKGRFLYFTVKKKNWTSQMAVEKIAFKLNINVNRFSYAGQKDKNALTTQYVAVENILMDKLKTINIKDMILTPKGYADNPIRLGSVSSNYFSITIRDLDQPLKNIFSFCNYYDDQRFGGIRPVNPTMGKLILQGKYEDALKSYLCYPTPEETKEHKQFRKEILSSWGDFKNVRIPGYLPNEKRVFAYLSAHPKDFIGAIKTIPKRISTLFIQSYQSLIFNKLLSEHVEHNFENCYKIKTNVGEFYCTDEFFSNKFPLPGHDFKEKSDIFKEEGISLEDFKIKEIPYLTSRTTYREGCVKLNNFLLSDLENDELNHGRKKQSASFTLPSGSYATTVIKCIARE